MFRKKSIIIVYETTEGVKGTFYESCRLFSYGTLFEKAMKRLLNKHESYNLIVTNVIKL
jgi:hypothetical protein